MVVNIPASRLVETSHGILALEAEMNANRLSELRELCNEYESKLAQIKSENEKVIEEIDVAFVLSHEDLANEHAKKLENIRSQLLWLKFDELNDKCFT